MKVLLIRLSAIGDTIHTLPVAHALKEQLPGSEISWLVEPASAPLLLNNPCVDNVISIPRKEWAGAIGKPWTWLRTFTAIGAVIDELRKANFDLVIDLQGLLKSGIWAGLSGSPLRVGLKSAREGAHLFLTDSVDVGDYFADGRHIVDMNLSVVDYVLQKLDPNFAGRMRAKVEFPLPAVDPIAAEKVCRWLSGNQSSENTNVSMVRNVVLIPGTTWPSKIWDWQKWARLAELILQQGNGGIRLCLVGGGVERATNAGIMAAVGQNLPVGQAGKPDAPLLVDLTGETGLVDLIALFNQASLVIGGDTGPLHLAAAVGQPQVVGIYGSTPVARNGPYGQQCMTVTLNLSCQPCFAKICPLATTACLKDLSPELVLDRLNKRGWL